MAAEAIRFQEGSQAGSKGMRLWLLFGNIRETSQTGHPKIDRYEPSTEASRRNSLARLGQQLHLDGRAGALHTANITDAWVLASRHSSHEAVSRRSPFKDIFRMDNGDFGLFAAACHDYEKVAHHSIPCVDKLDSKSFWATETPLVRQS